MDSGLIMSQQYNSQIWKSNIKVDYQIRNHKVIPVISSTTQNLVRILRLVLSYINLDKRRELKAASGRSSGMIKM